MTTPADHDKRCPAAWDTSVKCDCGAADLPEALRLADFLQGAFALDWTGEAAAEVRRLHSENERLAALAAGQATAAQAGVQDDLITLRKPTTSAELLWLLKLAHLVISDVDKTLEAAFAPAQPAVGASRFGSPELQAMIIARCVEKDQADSVQEDAARLEIGKTKGGVSPRQGVTYAALPEPLEIDWPELHSQALGCGVEDRDLHNRYECAEYGWQNGVDQCAERVPEQIFDADQMLAFADATCALRPSHGQAPAAAYKDSTPHLNVGDSSFESWYAGYVKEGTKGLKQHCRDAYAAGMGDPLVGAAHTPQSDPLKPLVALQEQAGMYVDDFTPRSDNQSALDDSALEDLAHSANQEALSFGIDFDVFMRLARTVRDRAARAPATSVQEDAARLDYLHSTGSAVDEARKQGCA